MGRDSVIDLEKLPDSEGKGARNGESAKFACCFVAGFLFVLDLLLFNGTPIDAACGVVGWARDESTVAEIALMLALFVMARRCPRRIRPKTLTSISVTSAVVGGALLALGIAQDLAWAIISSVVVTAVASAWNVVVWLLACATFEPRRMLVCLAASGACAVPVGFAVNAWVPLPALVVLSTACDALIAPTCLALTLPFFERLSSVQAPAFQQVSQPQAFLPLWHTYYVVIFAFSVAYGFGLRCESMSTAAMSVANFVALGCITAYAVISSRPRVETVYIAAFAAVAIGFMLILLADTRTDPAAAALLVAGYMCCQILIWFALCMAATRNVVDAIPTLCWGTAVGDAGIMCGVTLWMLPNRLLTGSAAGDGLAQGLIVVAMLATLTLYVTITRSTFDFDATIAGIAPDAPAVEQVVRYVDRLDDLCDIAVERYSLTARESQVMRLLAHGKNAAHIQEELGISLNTVKYHAKNVYAKLGVHSQQELIDLVTGA
jgi:DNA-binding CsgD family transcriptional regulator